MVGLSVCFDEGVEGGAGEYRLGVTEIRIRIAPVYKFLLLQNFVSFSVDRTRARKRICIQEEI